MEIKKLFGIKTETDYETRQPVCNMSIKYHKGGYGYLSYYYLSMMEESENVSKDCGYTSMQFDLFGNMNTSILLKVVNRKSAKVQETLDAWLAENADGLMNAWCFGMTRNMKHVYNYVLAHAMPDFDTEKYQRTDKLPGIQLLPMDYYAKTDAWWKLTSVVDGDSLVSFVKDFMSKHRDDYKAMTELYIAMSWQTDLLHGKNDSLRERIISYVGTVYDYFYDRFATDDTAKDYFFAITD